MIRNFRSETPGFYATIPVWALNKKSKITTIRAWNTDGKYLEFSRAKLENLVRNHKVFMKQAENGQWYIPSYSYVKFVK